jgi:hypothetical protein
MRLLDYVDVRLRVVAALQIRENYYVGVPKSQNRVMYNFVT